METFTEFVNNIDAGKDILNEGTIPTPTIVSLVRNAMYNYGMDQKPSPDIIANALNIKYDENPLDNKEFAPMYEKVCAAFTKARTAYMETLNKELKSIK